MRSLVAPQAWDLESATAETTALAPVASRALRPGFSGRPKAAVPCPTRRPGSACLLTDQPARAFRFGERGQLPEGFCRHQSRRCLRSGTDEGSSPSTGYPDPARDQAGSFDCLPLLMLYPLRVEQGSQWLRWPLAISKEMGAREQKGNPESADPPLPARRQSWAWLRSPPANLVLSGAGKPTSLVRVSRTSMASTLAVIWLPEATGTGGGLDGGAAACGAFDMQAPMNGRVAYLLSRASFCLRRRPQLRQEAELLRATSRAAARLATAPQFPARKGGFR